MTSAELELVEDFQLKEKITNEEFKIWKKTVPLLYDTIHTYALEYPSLVFQWLPDYDYSSSKDNIVLKYVIGTNTIDNSQNFLKVGSVEVPATLAPDFGQVVPNATSVPIPSLSIEDASNFRITTKWKQNGIINRLRVSPDGNKVLTFNSDGVIHYVDLKSNELYNYKYHKLEGLSLEWLNNESFLSGAKDSQIALWNVTKPSTPIQLFKTHTAAVNDLSSNRLAPEIFGSVADDSTTQFHDLRVAGSNDNPVIKTQNKHIQYAIDFHPDINTLYATAGKDNVVNLYDIRNHSTPIRSFFGHNDSVIGLKWNLNNDPNTLVSWSLDKRVIAWDLSNLDEEFTYPTAEETSRKRTSSKTDPCLKFIHSGHTNRINDIDIHPVVKNVLGSVGEDTLLEIWKPKTLVAEDSESEREESVEKEEEPAEEEKPEEPQDQPEAEESKPSEPEPELPQESSGQDTEQIPEPSSAADVEMTE